ncbi:glycosyltransferase family 2 protein [Novipirellula sp.]|uniref:glycosyltransferase family 2 protein n=1 Tax=Novipirellula sp. TaxID=2795430 RepID=UPI0035623B69
MSASITERRVDAHHSEDILTFIRDGVRVQNIPTLPDEAAPLHKGLTVCICTFKRPDSCVRFLDSLPQQDLKPNRLVIVDASPGDETEQRIAGYSQIADLADEVFYFRVQGAFQTLTCSRNFALRWVATDLLVFFDDDIVLQPRCLSEMAQVYRDNEDEVVGINAHDRQGNKTPPLLWRIRRLFRIVPHLTPGTYTRGGISVPWIFQPPTESVVQGDWLSGCAMMWKTSVIREVKFNEAFGGHSTGEDLDVSLRMGRHGKLMLAGKAHVLHLPDKAGRPNSYVIAYAGIQNAYDIHQRCLENRTVLDTMRFVYAFGLDTVLRSLTFVRPGQMKRRWNFVRGRTMFFFDRLFRRSPKRKSG